MLFHSDTKINAFTKCMCVFGAVMKNRIEGIDFGFDSNQVIGESEVKHMSKYYWTKEEYSDLSTYVICFVCVTVLALSS